MGEAPARRDKAQPGQRFPQRRVILHWFQAHRIGVLVDDELDLVPWAEIAKSLRDHDLPFRSNPM